jgi:type IV pilus assembly protein PilV
MRKASVAGFSLLEVLITIVVVSLGLLGVAGMQVAAIKLTDLSATRTTGVNMSSDIIERIRANPDGSADYQIAFGSTPTGTTLAALDLIAWKNSLKDPIKGVDGDGQIDIADDPSCKSVPPFSDCRTVRVQIRWDENRVRGGQAGKVVFDTKVRI